MKTMLSITLFQMMMFCTHLSGRIIETKHFSKITDYIQPDTLVVLDIDDTLLIPTQTLGSDAWFCYRLKQLLAENNQESALDKALAEWEAVRHLTKMKIVESGTERVIEGLQNRNVVVMGLTTQGLALATRSINQLLAVNIDLTKTAPSCEDHYFINQHGVLYRHGVLFTSGTPKGPALLKLLDIINFQPKHVVFINDKSTHLRDVEQAVECRNISFTGLRYSYCDERVAHFNPKIADIQWNLSTFSKILSDEEAESILRVPSTD